MDGAAHAVATRIAHRQTFGNHALTGESSVTVNQQRQHTECTGWFDLVLCRTHHTENDGIDGFKMARVGAQLEWDRRTLR